MEQTLTIKLKLYNPTQAKREIYQTMADRCTDFANRYLGLDKKERPKTSSIAPNKFRSLKRQYNRLTIWLA